MTKNLDLGLVRTFVAVADSGSMTVAAKRLHLTQGAISQQIKRLEAGFDGALFARAGRRLELSVMGERFLGKARNLLTLNDEVCADMTALPLRGTLRVGVPPDLINTAFPAIFRAFAESHPYVEISLRCEASPELTEKVSAGALDVAVIEQLADGPVGECLRIEPLVWARARGGNAHLKRPLPISMVAETCAFRQPVLSALQRAKIEWRTVFESGNLEATTATVRSDLAVTAWLASCVPSDLEIVTSLAELPALPHFAISLYLPPFTSPAAEGFAQHVRDAWLRH